MWYVQDGPFALYVPFSLSSAMAFFLDLLFRMLLCFIISSWIWLLFELSSRCDLHGHVDTRCDISLDNSSVNDSLPYIFDCTC